MPPTGIAAFNPFARRAPYRTTVPNTFSDCADFAMLIKVYRAAADGERKYSPAEAASVEVVPVMGHPDPERICTSIVERSNLSLRMGTRRFFKKVGEPLGCYEPVVHVLQLCRIHKSLRVTPAMAAGITNRVWDVWKLLN